ncbi:dockerin type I domain-containing protein [Botrimarina mediterranea]|uniref:Dockerin type I repeat protein n=1 Tax=Botrimarina mediterranea TaxID=2528022 RepID=A0A518K848_9BACT|nr:dockerin type I domain-containing protein [Botrimarina mediterranea]QDV73971.1 Dockerin type I repeat protein [Botrimarina mediterranea]
MKRPYRFNLALAAAIVASLVGATSASAVVLFEDTFDRANSRNIDLELTGITNGTGTTLAADGVYTQPFLDPANDPGPQDGAATNGGGAQILNSELQLAVGAGTSNAFVNHNFTNASILSSGAFSVSLDVLGYAGTGNGQGGAFAVGMSQAQALTAGDAFGADPNNAKFTNAFLGDSVDVISDFWVGIRGDGVLAWGNGAVAPGEPGFNSVNVGSKTGTISANFGVTSFAAGSNVNYEVFFNGVSRGVGSFSWSGTNENFIGIDARDGTNVRLDNFLVETSTPPATPALTIDRETGAVTLINETNQPLSMTIYSLTTEAGGFNQANWSKIETQGIDTNDDWITLTDPSSTTDLSEATLGEYTLGATGSANDEINLGNAWIQSPFEDVQVEVRDAAGNDVPIIIRYTGNGGEPLGLADYNGNGVVDSTDWVNVRDNLISDVSALQPIERYLAGDLNSDGQVNSTDFRQFKTLYEADNGVGSFATLLAVPEPTSACLVLVGLALLRTRRAMGRAVTLGMLAACGLAATTQQASAVNLFTDTFDRPDSRNIDAVLTGITNNTGTSLPADGVYTQPHVDPANEPGPQDGDAINGGGAQILGNQLQLAVGAGTSNAFVNHNFTNGSILADGGFRVSLDVSGYGGTSNGQGGGFGIGMSQAEASIAGDAVNGNPGLGKITNAFQDPAFFANNAVSDFWFGIRGNSTVAWGAGAVAPGAAGYNVATVGAKTGTISATFAPSGFNQGDSVAYEVFYNDVSQGFGVFAWSEDMANFIGIDSRDGAAVQYDNFTVETVDAAINPLRLQINTGTGAVSIAGGDVANDLDFYEVQSASAGLVAGAFDGLGGAAGFPTGNGSGNGWELNGVQTTSLLSESYLQSSSTFAAGGAAISLGSIYNTSLDARDLEFYYETPTGQRLRGYVEYISGVLPDFNSDGKVDAADYTVWRDNEGITTGATLAQGDANGDGAVNSADYLAWKTQYGATAAPALAVPEPVTLASALLGLFALLTGRRPCRAPVRG